MTTFFISPFEPPEWFGETELEIDPAEYADRLRERWPDIQITTKVNTEHHLLLWSIKQGHGVMGSLMGGSESGQMVSMKGLAPDVIGFTLWHRALVPAKYRLFFFNDGLHISVELKEDTTEEELLDAIESTKGRRPG